ncbi:MAG TPA: CoA transferase, partial [Bacillales bacterium]
AVIENRTLTEWLERFSGKETCVTPVNSLEEMANDPQVLARDMIQSINGFRQIGQPIKLSETPGEIQSRAPLLGEHTNEILEKIGLSAQEIDQLKRNNVI